MSKKEVSQVKIFEQLTRREVKQTEVAATLGLSVRQVKRKLSSYKLEGAKALVHKGKGKVSNNKIDQTALDQAMDIIRDKYQGFGPTLVHEELVEKHGFQHSLSSLRGEMIKEELWKPKKRKPATIHQLRERRACFGELVQLDGSPHDWFEGRGPKCNLNVAIDDATGNLMLLFSETETTQDYFQLMEQYCLEYGAPAVVYTDKNSIFVVNTPQNLDYKKPSKSDEDEGLTQFGRAMKELGTKILIANGPEAKGRVERVNRTLQDRLVKKMRLTGIGTIEQANAFLPQFTKEFNRKFSVSPRSAHNMHIQLPDDLELTKILCTKEKRVLSRNLTLQYQNTIYQIKTNRSAYTLRKTTVIVAQKYDGTISIWDYRGKPLDYTSIKKLPKQEQADSKELNHMVDGILAKRKKKNPWESDPALCDEDTLFYKPAGAV